MKTLFVDRHLMAVPVFARKSGIYEQSTRPRPDPVLFHSWGTLNGLLIATEIVGDDASIICIMFQT